MRAKPGEASEGAPARIPAPRSHAPRHLRVRRPRSRVLAVLIDSWTLLIASAVVFAGVLLGFLLPVDEAVAGWRLGVHYPSMHGLMEVLDHVGQRAVCLPLLAAATALVAWRRRRWWPVLVAVSGVLAINVVVGAIKLTTDRPSPRTGTPELWQYGDLFPSGHSANVVFVYGLMAWLLVRDTRHGRQWAGWLVGLVAAGALGMFVISIYRDTHWLTDLVLGALIGALVLKWTIIADVRGDRDDEHDHLQRPRGSSAGSRRSDTELMHQR
ncbi:MAG TPA: phosphatase PAP2 family protein [Actinomycetes bacterium]|nr:phosphatase PAP2 family protein [Actinomycetes bacterium]